MSTKATFDDSNDEAKHHNDSKVAIQDTSDIPIHPLQQSTDLLYKYNIEQIAQLRKQQPYETDSKYFTHVKISTLACMKMLRHALLGVERGIADNGVPQEIMGLCIGKPIDHSIIILDVAPLPVTGTETRVVADDAQMHMIGLMESLELRRKDTFTGWYHSHPFDVESYSHCHLSNTDVLTQQNWQRTSPMWIAIVIDPLRSIALQQPEIGAYRVYQNKHVPAQNECPDGTVAADDTTRAQRWGHSHNQYYELAVSYFNSELGNNILQNISSSSVWASILSSNTQLAADTQQKLIDAMNKINNKLVTVSNSSHISSVGYAGGKDKKRDTDMNTVVQQAQNIQVQAEKQCISMHVKQQLFQSFTAAQTAILNKHRAEQQANGNTQTDSKLPHSNSSMQIT